MKQVAEIIDRIDSDGGKIYVQGDRLKLRIRSGLLSDQDKQFLTDHRDVFFQILSGADTNTIQRDPGKTPIVSTATAEIDRTADEDQAERDAIQWVETGPAAEISEALDQAVGWFDSLVDGVATKLSGTQDQDLDPWTWAPPGTELIDPVACSKCGSLECWLDLRDGRHCMRCDPPIIAQRLRAAAKRIRRRDHRRTRRHAK